MREMKDLTKKELLDLFDGDSSMFDAQVDFDCACRGIKLLPTPPTEPKVKKFEGSIKTWVIDRFVFLNREDANAVLEVLQDVKLYSYSGWGDDKYPEPVTSDSWSAPKISQETVMSKEEVVRTKAERKLYETEKKEYEEKKKEYDDIADARQGVRDELLDLAKEANQERMKINTLRSAYDKYLVMAENNERIAVKFLFEAYTADFRKFKEVVRTWMKEFDISDLCPSLKEGDDDSVGQ